MAILVKFLICSMIFIYVTSKLMRKGSIIIKAQWLEKYYDNQILVEGASVASAVILVTIYLIFW